jgi:hypothetical protein
MITPALKPYTAAAVVENESNASPLSSGTTLSIHAIFDVLLHELRYTVLPFIVYVAV